MKLTDEDLKGIQELTREFHRINGHWPSNVDWEKIAYVHLATKYGVDTVNSMIKEDEEAAAGMVNKDYL